MRNEYEIVKMLSDAQNYRAQQDAMQYAAMNQNGWGGGLGAILAGVNGYMGKKRGEQASELEAQAQAAEAQRQQAAAEAEAIKAQEVQKAKFEAVAAQFGPEVAQAHVIGGVPLDQLIQKQTTLQKNLADPTARAHLERGQNRSGVTVNNNMPGTKYGKIPEGFVLKETPQGAQMVPVEGSPAAREAQQAQNKAIMRGMGGWNDAGNIDQVIEKSLAEAGTATTGAVGSLLSLLPGTDAHDLKENMKTIEADAAFTSLQNMRENSKTGGALGQVSERELGLLSSAKAALSTSQSPEQYKENLRRYQQVRKQAMENTAKAYELDYGQPAPWLQKQEPQQDLSSMSDEELMRAIQGG